MSEPRNAENKILATIKCPKCGHCYGYVYDNEDDNNSQRSVACCECHLAPVTVPVGEEAPTTFSPVATPDPATGVTEGNSSVSAQTLPDEEDGVKEPEPIADDSKSESLGQKPAPARFTGGGNSSVSADLGQEPAPVTFAGGGNSSAFSRMEMTYEDRCKVAEDIAWTEGKRPIHGDKMKRWTCHLKKCWLPYPGSGRTLNGRGSYGSCNGYELCDECHKAGGYSPRGIWD
jgi:hypothetical protein